MPIFTATNVNSAGAVNAQLIRRFRRWTMLHIQNVSAQKARIAVDKYTLENPVSAAGGIGGGLNLPASQTAPISLWWIGELWLIADTIGSTTATSVNVEAMEGPIVAPSVSGIDQAAQAQVTSGE